MGSFHPPHSAIMLEFRPRLNPCAGLTTCDRLEVVRWRDRARLFGFDRLVIHERAAGDPPELGSFLSVHRRGEPWSEFVITRSGGRVVAWCARTHRDVGAFESVPAALLALLPAEAPPAETLPVPPAGNVVQFASLA